MNFDVGVVRRAASTSKFILLVSGATIHLLLKTI
jgi:hypothetical protein